MSDRRTYAGKLFADSEYWIRRADSSPQEREYLRAFVEWCMARYDPEPGESRAAYTRKMDAKYGPVPSAVSG